MVPGTHIGPVISAAAKERIERYITEAEKMGAKVLVDGRGYDGAREERTATTSARRSSTTSRPTCASRRRKCSGR